MRAIMASAALGVTEPFRFALNELFLRRGVHKYELRRSGQTVFIRHPASDAWMLHEVINRRLYTPPPEVWHAIQARARSPRIVDLGAHVGTATLLFLELFPTARVLAVEPNPENAALLRRTIESNHLGEQCKLYQAAAGVVGGTATIVGSSGLSHLVRGDTVEAVDLMPPLRKFFPHGVPTRVEVLDVFTLLDGVDLLKMDIEGAEWPILQDPRFSRIPISSLVMEYHPQGAPQAETIEAVRRLLSEAGFTVGQPFQQFGEVGLVWAWRE
jgi:FkbM family methyltransferase